MNEQKRTVEDTAGLFREWEVGGVEHPLHAIAFAEGKLVVASGRYLCLLAPYGSQVIDQFQTSPRRGGGLTYDGRWLWQHGDHCVQQLNLRKGEIAHSFKLALENVTGIACLKDHLLILHDGGRRVARVHPERRHLATEAILIDEVATDMPLRGFTWAGDELWSSSTETLVRVDPTTARVRRRVTLPSGTEVVGLAADSAGRFWTVDGVSRTVRVFALASEQSSGRAPCTPPLHLLTGSTFDRILVPIDFSGASRRALATALVLQDVLHAEVHLLHLAEQGANAEFLAGTGAGVAHNNLAETAQARLRHFVDNVSPGRSDAIQLHAKVLGGDLVAEIRSVARDIGATLVIMCTGARQTLFRTHIERVAREIDIAVMVLGHAAPGEHAD